MIVVWWSNWRKNLAKASALYIYISTKQIHRKEQSVCSSFNTNRKPQPSKSPGRAFFPGALYRCFFMDSKSWSNWYVMWFVILAFLSLCFHQILPLYGSSSLQYSQNVSWILDSTLELQPGRGLSKRLITKKTFHILPWEKTTMGTTLEISDPMGFHHLGKPSAAMART